MPAKSYQDAKKRKNRQLLLESLEDRRLMTMDLGQIASRFNSGMANLRVRTTHITAEIFSRDIAQNVPIIDEGTFAESINARPFVGDLFRGRLQDASSIDAAIQDLRNQNFTVEYLSTEKDARGDYLRLEKSLSKSAGNTVDIAFRDLEGIDYFASAKGTYSGRLRGSVEEFNGTIIVGLDSRGFYLGASSKISAQGIRAVGGIQGTYDIGLLDDVGFQANGTFQGTVSGGFGGQGAGSKLRLNQLATGEFIHSSLNGTVNINNATFQGQIPNVSSLNWSGSFRTRIRNDQVTSNENLQAPSYQSIMANVRLGFVEGLKQLEWVKKLDSILDVKIPFVDKSVQELVKFESIIDKAMDSVGFELLPSSAQSLAMRQLIQGKDVNLAEFKKDLSVELAKWSYTIFELDWKKLGGLAEASLSAEIEASLNLTAKIHVGIGTRGFWVDDTSYVGIQGGVYGSIKGSAKLLTAEFISVVGSLGFVTDLQIGLTSPNPGNSKIYLSDLGRNREQIVDGLLDLMSLDVVASIKAKAEAKLFWIFKWKEEWEIAKVLDIHIGPKSGSILQNSPILLPLVAAETYEGEQLTVEAKSNNLEYVIEDKTGSSASYSRNRQLRMRSDKDGWIEFAVLSEADGQHELRMHLTANREQSAFRAFWNGQQIANPIDLFRDSDGTTVETVSVGMVDVLAGVNILRLRLLNGSSPLDDVYRELGLDKLDLVDSGAHGTSPVAVTNLRIENRWATMIDLRWNAVQEATFYSIEQWNGADWTLLGRASGGSPVFRVRDLQRATDYRFRVASHNSYGSSEPVEIDARTRDIIPDAPTTLRVDNRFARAIDLRWNDQSNNEIAFRVAISTDGVNWDNIAVTGPNTTSLRVNGLTPKTRYWFKVRAANEEGFSDYSNVVEVVSRDEVPANPTDLRVENRFARAIDLRWNDQSNNESEFRIAISVDGVNWNNVATTSPNTTSLRVNDLAPKTRYWFKVRAANEEGFSGYSNTVEVMTRDEVPASPSDLRIDNRFARAIDLRWNDQSNNESEFRIAISLDGVNWDNVATTSPNTTSLRVNGLTPKTRYWFKVRAANDEGFSDYSNTVEVVTRDEVPAGPANLVAANIWATQIDLNWIDQSNNEDGFRIEISQNGSDWSLARQVEANRTGTRISGLVPNRFYYFRVQAFNGEGGSEFSNVLRVRTRAS